MIEMQPDFIYGPVPSRRLGISLGVSPIPKKTCNYACVYCQLGRTNPMTNTRKMFFKVQEILNEFDYVLSKDIHFDVVTIVGEGEPTLYLGLDQLIRGIKSRTDKPVAVITNGALLYEDSVKEALMEADIVLPSFDAPDETLFKQINRPHGDLKYHRVLEGLSEFSKQYKGELWIEIMFVKGMNDTDEALETFKKQLGKIQYNRLYINTPVRPPCEETAVAVSMERIEEISQKLGGLSIDFLVSEGFSSNIEDDLLAIKSIIKRHPMNQYEIQSFLDHRNCKEAYKVIKDLKASKDVKIKSYRGYDTYQIKV
jgi:wyosine [tRNA(Phe)-imidazoG37] synthetase (radical SAM superfamily)